MGESVPPYGPRDAVVIDRPSRYAGLRVTSVAFAQRTPRIRAWLHSPGWDRVVATATAESAGKAAVRAEDLVETAQSRGVPVQLPRLRRVHAA
jgi:hypothetical protein